MSPPRSLAGLARPVRHASTDGASAAPPEHDLRHGRTDTADCARANPGRVSDTHPTLTDGTDDP
jgi:hypothetical protein